MKGETDFMGSDGSSFGWYQLEKKKIEEENRKKAECLANGVEYIEDDSVDSDESYGGDDSLIGNEMNWDYDCPLEVNCPVLAFKQILEDKNNTDPTFFQELWGSLGDAGQKDMVNSFEQATRQHNEKKNGGIKVSGLGMMSNNNVINAN